ncbi:MAG: MFS transporter, partial [Lysobacteraceae bacterium]
MAENRLSPADDPATPPVVLASSIETATRTAFPILLMLCTCHLLNDMMQSLLPSIYPLLQQNFTLSFSEVGLITLVFQLTASMLQPLVGIYTDKHPMPYSLPIGMTFT